MRTWGIIVAVCAALTFSGCGKKDEGTTESAAAKPDEPPKPDDNAKPAPDDNAKPARGEPEPEPGEATAKRESYGQALKRGRALAKESKHAEAAEAFKAALVAKPNDPMALSELSWVAFKKGDHDAAIEAASKSVAGANHDPSLQAASLFNRANAKQAKGDKDGAIADYTTSYQLRPHKAVRARLEKMGAKVPESVWTAKALEGPFADGPTYCKAAGGCLNQNTDLTPLQKVDASKLSWTTALATTIIEEDDQDGFFKESLLFKTSDGWMVLRAFERYINRYDWGVTKVEVVDDRVAIYTENSDGRFETDHDRMVTVCGVGASKRISCHGPTILAEWFIGYEGTKEDGHNLPPAVEYDCTATFIKGDRLEIKAKDKGCRGKLGFAGEHKLAFP